MALAMLDTGGGGAGRIGVLPFAAEPPVAGRSGFEERPSGDVELPPPGVPLVVALGILHPIRQPLRLLEAFATACEAVTDARLAFVGPAPEALRDEVLDRAESLGLSGSVVVTGQIDTAGFLAWAGRATVAVQLRERWNGEASGSIGECVVAGVPLMVADLGWMHELPDDCVVKVDPGTTAAQLGDMIAAVLLDEDRRLELRRAALEFAPRLSFRHSAEVLVEQLFGTPQSPAGDLTSPPGRTTRSTRRTGSRSAGRS